MFCCRKEGCFGVVTPQTRDGRYYFHRGVTILLPAAVSIPRCNICGADYLGDTLLAVVNDILDAEYKRHEKVIKRAIERHEKKIAPKWMN